MLSLLVFRRAHGPTTPTGWLWGTVCWKGFGTHAGRAPQRIAVTDWAGSVDYQTLDRWSDQVAESLEQAGVIEGQIVGVLVTPSVAWVVTMIGILKAGAAFLPLDTGHPRQRLEELIADAALTSVCTLGEPHAALTSFTGDVIDVAYRDIASPTRPLPNFDGAKLAYVLYTSARPANPRPRCSPTKT